MRIKCPLPRNVNVSVPIYLNCARNERLAETRTNMVVIQRSENDECFLSKYTVRYMPV